MRNTQGYIPKNLGGGTIWDGRLKIRNATEAVIICSAIYFVTVFFERFVPNLVLVSIRLVLWLIFGVLALKGIGGEPLSIWFLNIINYSGTRTYVTLRPPSRELEETPKKKKSLIFTDGPAENSGGEQKKRGAAKAEHSSRKEARRKAAEEKRSEKERMKAEKKAKKQKKREYAKEQKNAKKKNR